MATIIAFPQDCFFVEEVTDELGATNWVLGKIEKRKREVIKTYPDRRSATYALAMIDDDYPYSGSK